MRYLASTAQLRATIVRYSLLTVPLILALGTASGFAARSGPDNPWFQALAKPALFPPPIAFPIVWTTLYVLMGVALALILAAQGAWWRGPAIATFALQLALNLAWAPLFFGAHQIAAALLLIGALALALIVTIVMAFRVRALAGVLLLPYLAWVLFASVLNWQFLALNPDGDGQAGVQQTVRLKLHG